MVIDSSWLCSSVDMLSENSASASTLRPFLIVCGHLRGSDYLWLNPGSSTLGQMHCLPFGGQFRLRAVADWTEMRAVLLIVLLVIVFG